MHTHSGLSKQTRLSFTQKSSRIGIIPAGRRAAVAEAKRGRGNGGERERERMRYVPAFAQNYINPLASHPCIVGRWEKAVSITLNLSTD
jgi:hypothetical protein